MSILHALILGIVEGLTEFLPVSSTFHLIQVSRLLGYLDDPFVKMFEVVIQAGAIFSLVFIYAGTLLGNRKLAQNVIASFMPTAIVGTVLYKLIKGVFFNAPILMYLVFFGMGVLFLIVEHMVKTQKITLTKKLDELDIKQSLAIGLAQSLAVIPGVSRSGSVIVAMMASGYERAEAAKYTFLLSLPTIFAASALDLWENKELLLSGHNYIAVLAVGFIAAFISAYLVVKWFLEFLRSHTLSFFAWYRFAVLGLLALIGFLR